MDITYNVSKATGVYSKTIRIETNDPVRNIITYQITANIIRDIHLTPGPNMRFRNIPLNEESRQTVTIKNNSDKAITFSDAQITPEDLKINTSSKFTIQPNSELEIIGTYTPETASNHNGKITFTTDNAEQPKIEISVQINVKVPK